MLNYRAMPVTDNINNMCRLCAQVSRKSTLVSLFSSTSLENNLPDKINCHLPIKVSKYDGFPQAVCPTCIKKLNICHELISSCLAANNKIQQVVNEIAKVEWVSQREDGQVRFAISSEGKVLLEQEVVDIVPEPEPPQEVETLESTEQSNKPVKKRSKDTDSVSEIEDEVDRMCYDSTQEPVAIRNVTDDQNQDHAEPQQLVEPEIVLAVVAHNPGKELEEFDSTSELFLVSLAYNDYTSYEERLNAAREIVNKQKISQTSVSQGSCDHTTIICSSCSLDFTCPPNLDLSQEQQTVQCEHCGHLNKQESVVLLNPHDILKELVYHIHNSVETFHRNSSECGVTMLGMYCEKNCAFVMTNHPPKNADKKTLHSFLSYEEEKTISYICGICQRSLPFTKEYFTIHLIKEHFGVEDALKKLKQTCKICSKTFTQVQSLNNHMKTVHGNKNKMEKLMCDVCGKLVIRRLMNDHKKFHSRLECQYCHEIVSYRTWTRHKQYQENPGKANYLKDSCVAKPRKFAQIASTFPCEYCNVVLARKNWMYHSAYQALFGPNAKCPEIIPSPEEKKLSIENQALFKFKFKKASSLWYLRKQSTAKGFTITKDFAIAKDFAKKPKSECPVCHKLLSHYQYKNHVNKHYGNLPFKCGTCNKSFATKTLLSKHIKMVHLKIGKWHCQYCNKFFERRSKLESHEALHRGERNFKCPFCPKYFPGPRNVYGHITLVHEGRYKVRKRNCKKGESSDNAQDLEVDQPTDP